MTRLSQASCAGVAKYANVVINKSFKKIDALLENISIASLSNLNCSFDQDKDIN